MNTIDPAAPDARPKRKRPRPEPSRDAISYTLGDAARISGLSPATLRRRAAEGRLRLFRCGGRRLADGDSLRALLGSGGAD